MAFPFLGRIQSQLSNFFQPSQGSVNLPPEISDVISSANLNRVPSIAGTIRGLMGSGQAKASSLPAQPAPTPSATPTPTPASALQALFGRVSQYGATGNLTATGTTPEAGRTAAVSPDLLELLPYGTLIQLPDGSIYRVEDRTADSISSTLDVFSEDPRGLQRNVPYSVVGKDMEGLRYGRGVR